MRFSIILLLTIFINAFAVDDKEVNSLFNKYDQVMELKKSELIEEVFTKKFLENNGGKKEFIAKIKDIPKTKSLKSLKVTWYKGRKSEIYFAKYAPTNKSKNSDTQFILKVEDGKLKIDGTLSDDD